MTVRCDRTADDYDETRRADRHLTERTGALRRTARPRRPHHANDLDDDLFLRVTA